MSDIKVGDLVFVVHACCPATETNVGRVYEVLSLGFGTARCVGGCERVFPGFIAGLTKTTWAGLPGGAPTSWLRKVDPGGVTIDEKDEVTA